VVRGVAGSGAARSRAPGEACESGPIAEPELRQKLLQSAASFAFIAVFVVSGLERRGAWSRVPSPLVLAGDAVVIVGLYIVFKVFRANTFTSAVVEVAADQRLVSTGPYAVVRHPMYVGALLMLLGVPLALASVWAFFARPPLAAVIIVRLLGEEAELAARLPGYRAYQTQVRYRLVRRVW
jgi:protein-S-isoprenylcysteine O-methyltransferase Ste14